MKSLIPAQITLSLAILISTSGAHPGEEHHVNKIFERDLSRFKLHTRNGLSACADKLAARGITDRAALRRKSTIADLQRRAAFKKRDTSTVLATSHHSNASYNADTSETTIFGSNHTCILNPEGEVGPYWVPGELIRNNLVDNEPGVPLTIEGQFIDVETCDVISGIYWDVWNCNSTGVYSGVVTQGNGNTADTSNYNNTALRGVAESDSDGVVNFETVFPGHYSGRTTHIHMVAHLGATVNANNTLTGGTIPHVGQFFFDQDLITEVEATSPYNTNTVTVTTNSEDRVFGTETSDTTSDPVFEYVLLGDSVSDGIFAWLTLVVNQSAAYDPSYSFTYTSSGGIAESGGTSGVVDGGSGDGGPPGNFSMSGSPPSGSGTAVDSGVVATGSTTSATSTSTSASSTATVSTGESLGRSRKSNRSTRTSGSNSAKATHSDSKSANSHSGSSGYTKSLTTKTEDSAHTQTGGPPSKQSMGSPCGNPQ